MDNMLEDTSLQWKKVDGNMVISSIDKKEDTTGSLFEAATQVAAEQSKALFFCFQIAINDTAVQLSVQKNKLKHNKAAKKAAFASLAHKNPRPGLST